jgi:hypothetical protein
MVVWLTLVFMLTSKTFTIMFTKNAFVVLGFVILFCSCGGRANDEEIDALNKTLQQGTISIIKNNAEGFTIS